MKMEERPLGNGPSLGPTLAPAPDMDWEAEAPLLETWAAVQLDRPPPPQHHTHTFTHTCTLTHTHHSLTHSHTHSHNHSNTLTHTHTPTHTFTYSHTRTHSHTCTHTHTHSPQPTAWDAVMGHVPFGYMGVAPSPRGPQGTRTLCKPGALLPRQRLSANSLGGTYGILTAISVMKAAAGAGWGVGTLWAELSTVLGAPACPRPHPHQPADRAVPIRQGRRMGDAP